MAAFDTAITPVDVTPANTANATLFTAAEDTSVLVDVANIGTTSVQVRIGITPSGGSVAWRVFDLIVQAGNSLLRYGPVFLTSGDAVTVRTNTADDVTFSADGVRSTP